MLSTLTATANADTLEAPGSVRAACDLAATNSQLLTAGLVVCAGNHNSFVKLFVSRGHCSSVAGLDKMLPGKSVT
jgi:hypothetical protein